MPHSQFVRFVFAWLAFAMSAAAMAKTCNVPARVQSGPATATVVELYTSEGCNSCPPADKWFSALPAGDRRIVPLAFHVDYWDYIGWKDRFGRPAFADRQRATVARQGSRTVYTPQIMLDGKDIRGGSFNTGFDAALRLASSRPAQATLSLVAVEKSGALSLDVNVKVPDNLSRKQSALFFAITEDRLASRVTAGENKGVMLQHDHVVRELIGPIELHADGALDIHRDVALGPDWKRPDLSVAAFVQNQSGGEILQAVTIPLCGAAP